MVLKNYKEDSWKRAYQNGGIFFKKTRRNREEAGLSLIRHEHIYQAIKEEHKEHNYPIAALCKLGKVSRAAYYKWLHREIPKSEQKNRLIADEIERFTQTHRIKAIEGSGMTWNDIMVLM